MYPGAAARMFGTTGTAIIGGGHKIAIFPSPVHGAAANMQNLSTGYIGMTVGNAIQKWSGGGRGTVPGFDSNQVITPEMASDPNFMIPFMKSVTRGEAPGRYPMDDPQWQQAFRWYQSGGVPEGEAPLGRTPQPYAPPPPHVPGAAPRYAPPAIGPGGRPTDLSQLNIQDITGQSTRKFPAFKQNPQAIITHYTSGSTLSSAVDALNDQGLGYNYIVDRDGSIKQFVPTGQRGAHIRSGWGPVGSGLSNENTIGISAVANNEDDLTPAQRETMQRLTATLGRQYGISPQRVFGHGEVNPGHRQTSEGRTTYQWARSLTKWPDVGGGGGGAAAAAPYTGTLPRYPTGREGRDPGVPAYTPPKTAPYWTETVDAAMIDRMMGSELEKKTLNGKGKVEVEVKTTDGNGDAKPPYKPQPMEKMTQMEPAASGHPEPKAVAEPEDALQE